MIKVGRPKKTGQENKKMMTLSCEEYHHLKRIVSELAYTWNRYQIKFPDGWYEFKYQTVLHHFVMNDMETHLTSQIHRKRFPKRVKLAKSVYKEMKYLAEICLELQDVLNNPPYGSSIPELINRVRNVKTEAESGK